MNYSIIVVDDDQDFLESIQRVLVISGFKNLRVFQDPIEAADMIKTGNQGDYCQRQAAILSAGYNM